MRLLKKLNLYKNKYFYLYTVSKNLKLLKGCILVLNFNNKFLI